MRVAYSMSKSAGMLLMLRGTKANRSWDECVASGIRIDQQAEQRIPKEMNASLHSEVRYI